MGNCLQRKKTKNAKKRRFSVGRLPTITENPNKITKEYRLQSLIKQIDPHYNVFSAYNVRTHQKYVVRKYQCGGDEERDASKEIEIHADLDHPFIMNIVEYFKSKFCIFLVTEFFDGKNLSDYIVESDKFEEKDIINIIRQLLVVTNYAHKRGIMNRNLSLNNLMYNGNSIKIIGFNMAERFVKGQCLRDRPRSLFHYRSPEMLKQRYDEKCDVWAIGVIAHVLLTGSYPFDNATADLTKNDIMNKSLDLEKLKNLKVSADASDFIKKSLTKFKDHRPSAEEFINHRWLENNSRTSLNLKLNKTIINNINNFHTKTISKKQYSHSLCLKWHMKMKGNML